MRILDVSPRLVWPAQNGSAVRTYHLMRGLSNGHEVRQFSTPRLRDLRAPGFEVDVFPTSSYREYRDPSWLPAAAAELCHRSWIRPQAIFTSACLRLTRPARLSRWLRWADIAMIEFPWSFAYCRRAAPALPIVLASHNIEVLTRTSNARAAGIATRRSPLLAFVARVERHAVAHADLILAVSDEDRRHYIDCFGVSPTRVVTVPNGSDTSTLVPASEQDKRALRARLGLPDRRTVAYIAAGPKVPDLEGLKWVRRVARREPDLSFLIVGGISRAASVEGNVIATGRVADHRPYLQAADISLNPIEHGGGTKIKLLDSLAAGLATVAFKETIRGTALRDGEHVIVAEADEDALVGAVRRLSDNPQLAGELAAAGRSFVCRHHDWDRIASGLDQTLVEFAARFRGSGGW